MALNAPKSLRVLAFETSCDETAAAFVEVTQKEDGTCTGQVLSEHVFSQIAIHEAYGGVIPEIASRAHLERIAPVAHSIFANTTEGWREALQQVDCVAATTGPGLLGGLIVGHVFAKSLAQGLGKPFAAVNHIESHILTSGLTDNLHPEYTVMLASGGHCQLLSVADVGVYQVLGQTKDDSVGECFDKVAAMLGLPYPGGPQVEKMAKKGDNTRFALPRPLLHDGLDFSFSGLKTAVRQCIDRDVHHEQDKADLCASFQTAVAETLTHKCKRALEETRHKALVVAGGVAANQEIRTRLEAMCKEKGIRFAAPPLRYCTDNAAMIAYTAGVRALLGADDAHHGIVPRWPLAEMNWRMHGE